MHCNNTLGECVAEVHISVKELLSRCRCDNVLRWVVAILCSDTSICPREMCLVRFVFAARFNIVLLAEHIPGVENGAIDALSIDGALSFFTQVPWARSNLSRMSEELRRALVEQLVELTSETWRKLLRASWQIPSLRIPERHTRWGSVAS